ncbi:MAG: hypothetical protein WB992_25105, partial [Bryobacteraceae bacterium]
MLQRLASLANEKQLQNEARILQDAARSADQSSPDARKRFLLTAAFHLFLEDADPLRRYDLERLLEKELDHLRAQFKHFSEAINKPAGEVEEFLRSKPQSESPENTKTKREVVLRAADWVLGFGGEEREKTARFFVRAIRDAIRKRKASLTESELHLLGELGQEAVAQEEVFQERVRSTGKGSPNDPVMGIREELRTNPAKVSTQLLIVFDDLDHLSPENVVAALFVTFRDAVLQLEKMSRQRRQLKQRPNPDVAAATAE